jgi:arylsulfatase A-like enzyme
VAAAILAAVFSVGSVTAQNTVSGRVTPEDGMPLKGVTVTTHVDGNPGDVSGQAVTNDQGAYELSLSAGEYSFSATPSRDSWFVFRVYPDGPTCIDDAWPTQTIDGDRQDVDFDLDKTEKPNIILVFLDDAGYADFGVTGSSIPTPTIDSLASNGVQFTQLYDASPVCSASRAALLTGRYPDRFSFENVLFPDATQGLPQEEETLAELLKKRGYSTHIFGKWHLGHLNGALPLSHGFDEYYGIPYSNDMWPYKRDSQALDPDDEQAYVYDPASPMPPLPLYEGNTIAKASVTPSDQKMLTKVFTDRAIEVIETKAEEPFFIYLPYSASHIPIFVRDEIRGKSGGSLYQDVIYEFDLQMARIMKALRDNGVEQNTLVIFTSDNGPWTVWGDHAGSAGELRGFKMTTFEGGIRVFAAMHWPAGFNKGVTVTSPVMTIDILPTIAEIIGAEPSGEKLDGESLVSLIEGKKSAGAEPRALYNYFLGELESMRYGKWKLHLPHDVRTVTRTGSAGFRGDYGKGQIDWSLYDLDADPGERVNLIDHHPEAAEKLKKMAAAFSSELEASKKPMGDYREAR